MVLPVQRARRFQVAGFTLVELAIVLLITGIFMSMGATLVSFYMQGRERTATKQTLQVAQAALKQYLKENGHYPCPASRMDKTGDEGFGVALAECVSDAPLSQDLKAAKTLSVKGRNDARVRIGVLPFRTLGLSERQGRDGWDRVLHYAVTESLTVTSRYNQKDGAIDVMADDGKSRVVPPGTMQYVVFSNGRDECAAGTENCDADAVFLDAQGPVKASEAPGQTQGGQKAPGYIAYHQYDPDVPGNGGMVFYFSEDCPESFSPIDTSSLNIANVDTLSQYPDHGQSQAGRTLCYSSRYATTMTLQISAAETGSCPEEWTSIGYRIFGGGGDNTMKYQVCAR